jgi:transposase
VLDAIAFKYRTGTPWVDLPKHFGSWKGVHSRLRTWAADGTLERVFTALLAQADAAGDLDWVVAVDSTIVRAHQYAAGLQLSTASLTSSETPSSAASTSSSNGAVWPPATTRPPPSTSPHSASQPSSSGQQGDPEEAA